MCPTERYTLKRGRSAVPDTLVRTRACTRWRCSSRDNLRTDADATVVSPSIRFRLHPANVRSPKKTHALRGSACFRAGLARLLLQTFAGDADALLLVRIRRTQRTYVRG